MRYVLTLLLTLCSVSVAQAEDSPSAILSANKAAMGGQAWDLKTSLDIAYAYSGQGLTGTNATTIDLKNGRFVDSFDTPPISGASGFDGERAWVQETSGIASWQGGGDIRQLSVNEAYRDTNQWWQAGFGGARVDPEVGSATENGTSFDVLTIAPAGGKPFAAWFDKKTHLLARTIEVQVTQTITTFTSDYAPVDGAEIAHRVVVDDGTGPANRQTSILTKATFGPALPAERFGKPDTVVHDFTIAGNAASTTEPFQLANNHIFANVEINGKGPFLFIFDTGGHNILLPETAKALGLKAKGATTGTGGGSGFVQSGYLRLDSLSIGKATLLHPLVSVTPINMKADGVNAAGMIGYEFFARFVPQFDYGHHMLTLFDKKAFSPATAGSPVPFALYGQFPEVRGSYNGTPGRFGIDTGARTALGLNASFVKAHGLMTAGLKGIEAVTGWGIGGPSRGFVTRGGMLMLGDVAIASPLTQMYTDTAGAGAAEAFPNNVGGGVLKRYCVTLDYDRMVMYLKPVAGPIDDLDTYDRAGLWMNQADQGFKVTDVTKGAPAEEAGMKTGDIVTAVDGKPAHDIPLPDLRYRLRNDKPGTVVTFTVQRDGKSNDIRVTLRDLV